ncbi:MAG: GAF domain-containing protein [Elusimicrobia bacterium]|nr:GAF domain-containing protein [Elusimicrobiota bacterium]
MDESERIARRESQLRNILAHIVVEPDLRRVLDLILKEGAKFLNMNAGGIILHDEANPNNYSYYAAMGIPIPYTTRIITEESGLISHVISERKLVMLQDFTPDTPFGKMWCGLGFKVVIAAPILYRDKLIGLIHLSSTDPGRRMDSFEKESFQVYAEYAGIAIVIAQSFEELRKHRARLEEEVAVRTAELRTANEKLNETMVQLKRSNAELEQFAYVASHDLQEPLRMVISYLQLLERHFQNAFDDKAKMFMNYAVDGGRRMQALISDLLFYSRVGRTEKPMTNVDVEIVMKNVLQNLGKTIRDKNVEIECGPMPKITGNEMRIAQLFQNLIANGIKFCEEGKTPKIKVAAERREKAWLFSVSDNGIGIDPKYFNKIFQVFQRLHSREEYPGTGIGLSVCQKIVELHGGEIRVDSGPGRGSTFSFTIADK